MFLSFYLLPNDVFDLVVDQSQVVVDLSLRTNRFRISLSFNRTADCNIIIRTKARTWCLS